MLTSTPQLVTTLKKDVARRATARLMAEWNHNRFAGPPGVMNTGVNYPDTDEFPLESIVSPLRPEKQGIIKAVTTNRVSYYQGGSVAEGYVQANYDDDRTVAGSRAYTVGSESKYKYWASPEQSALVQPAGYYALTNGSLEVTYTKSVWMNKLVLSFEATIAQPKNVTIWYKTTEFGVWVQWTGTFQVDADGRIVLFRQANGTMAATEYLTNPMQIRGVKVVVAGMSRASVPLKVIEISARLQMDLSQYIVDYSIERSMSDVSMVTPMGTCSSNTASLTLSNTTGIFDNDRTTLLDGSTNYLSGLIDKNIRMWLDLGVYVSGAPEYVRQFTMWTDNWGSQYSDTTDVALKDSSKILQEVKPVAMLHQNLTTSGIAWRLCDSVGMNNYNISTLAKSDNHVIDYFWTDPEATVWDHLQQIAQPTQTAIYFDEYDIMQVLPRNAAYDTTRSVSWTFDTENAGSAPVGRLGDAGKLADVQDISTSLDFEANVVNVEYTPTTVSTPVGRVVPMEQVWAPEDTTVLRSTRLIDSISPTSLTIRITQADARYWPYSATVNVEGEFIKYTHKGYAYYDTDNTIKHTYISSLDEQKKYDAKNPNKNYLNYYNGWLYCNPSNGGGRGRWGTVAKAHSVDLSGWGPAHYRLFTGVYRTWNGGMFHDKQKGVMSLSAPNTTSKILWYVTTHGSSLDTAPIYYGTKLRFPYPGGPYGAAGMVLSAGTNDCGYYIELVRSRSMNSADRAITNEINFYARYSNGTYKRMGPNGGKGVSIPISDNNWYTIDARLLVTYAGDHEITISVNGASRMVVLVPPANQLGESLGGRHGVFCRGYSRAEFEYVYSSTSAVQDAFDEAGWFDRINGGFQSSQMDREWVYGWRWNTKLRKGKPPQKVYSKYNSLFIDEFGPVVHEMREYDVKFTTGPVIHSNLYISNDAQVVCPEYVGNPFGASFLLANTSRINAVVSGEDKITFGSDNPVDQKLLVYGRVVKRDEPRTVTTRNEAAINRRGEVPVDISSPWIQRESGAKEIGAWINKQWAGGVDQVEVTSAGNPLIQLGDLVAIVSAKRNMTYATHKYFVVGISHNFDGGLETTFTLRRMKA
jgi:hypothetical protein